MLRHVTGFAIIVLVFSGAGCSPDGSGSTSSGMSGGSGGNGGGSMLTVPTCQRSCAAASDCVIAGTGEAFDADNYSCNAGICEHIGCTSDAECASSFPDQQNPVCRKVWPGYPATCTTGCQIADDCIMSGNPLLDADNFACRDGACEYTGCNSDAECAHKGVDYVCESLSPVPSCVKHKPCQSASDCPDSAFFPAQDEDNYSCVQGFCEYTGCNSDAECTSFPNGNYVCR